MRHWTCTIWLVVAAGCSNSPSTPTSPGGGNPGHGGADRAVTVIGAGDIGMCGSPGTAATARLVAGLSGDLLLAGDIAYMQGTATNFRDCFEPFWGQFRSRWHPVPGNHEYESPGAAPYFTYFGEAAAPEGTSYYALSMGDWLVLMIDSNIPAGRGSPQWTFVQQRLQAQRTPCTLAVWHHPLFTSGPNGPNRFMADIWGLLETAGAELYTFVRSSPNSEARITEFGVLRLTLRPAQVDWAYLGTNGAVLDQGLDTCR